MNAISKLTLVQFDECYRQAKTALEVWHVDTGKEEWKDELNWKGLNGE